MGVLQPPYDNGANVPNMKSLNWPIYRGLENGRHNDFF